jgi:hypothetical protein
MMAGNSLTSIIESSGFASPYSIRNLKRQLEVYAISVLDLGTGLKLRDIQDYALHKTSRSRLSFLQALQSAHCCQTRLYNLEHQA